MIQMYQYSLVRRLFQTFQTYLLKNKAYRLQYARAERGRAATYFLSRECASRGAFYIIGNAAQFPII